jgi:hypothetical protein
MVELLVVEHGIGGRGYVYVVNEVIHSTPWVQVTS